MQTNKPANLIVDLSFSFALDIIVFAEILYGMKKFIIANQILKCGTSIGANVREAQNAESKADFIHKFKLAAKEADEVHYWLLLCQTSDTYPGCPALISKSVQIAKVLSKIISTTKHSGKSEK